MIADKRERQQDFIEDFRLALLAHRGEEAIPRLWPGWQDQGPEETIEIPEDEIDDQDLLDSEGEWRFTDSHSQEEVEKVLAEMRGSGTIAGTDLLADDEGWE